VPHVSPLLRDMDDPGIVNPPSPHPSKGGLGGPPAHRVIVSIGEEIRLPFGAMGSIGVDDFHNALLANELTTRLHYDGLAQT